MSSLSALPNELFHMILVAAVKVRRVKRATRLRYVSKLWNVAVLEAIYASGILDGEKVEGPMMSRYAAYRALRPPEKLFGALRVIREVAERLVAHRSPDGICTNDAIRDCIFDICDGLQEGWEDGLMKDDDWSSETDTLGQNSDEGNDDFARTLMAAAVWRNEIELVGRLLPTLEDRLYLICFEARKGFKDYEGYSVSNPGIFGYPMYLAAFRGHIEILRLFMDVIDLASPENSYHYHLVIYNAARGNNLAIVELAINVGGAHTPHQLVNGLLKTSSVEIFNRLLPLARGYFEYRIRDNPIATSKDQLPSMMKHAVLAGNVATMEYLFQLGAPFPDLVHDLFELVHTAARHGQKAALACLLKRGLTLDQCSLEEAVWYGNPQLVQYVLDHLEQQYSAAQSLLIAVEKENEEVIKILMSLEPPHVDAEAKDQALQAIALASSEGQPRHVESCSGGEGGMGDEGED